MSIIHKTTLTPTKLELLTAWLPAQPWYVVARRPPELTKVGGFRLDDPAGEVGIEFMVVGDDAAGTAVFYQVPMTYRGEPLAGADDALIGTTEHGVLGRRWVYDGVRDPVLIAQLVACIQGDAEPQAQSISDAPDPTVTVRPVPGVRLRAKEFGVAANGAAGPTCGRVSSSCGWPGSSSHLVWPGTRACPRRGGCRTAPKLAASSSVSSPDRSGQTSASTASRGRGIRSLAMAATRNRA